MEKTEIEAVVREVLATWETSREMPNQSDKAAGRNMRNHGGETASRNLPNRDNPGLDQDRSERTADGCNRKLVGQNGVSLTEAASATKIVEANGGKLHVTMPLALAVKLIEKIEEKAAQWDMRVVTAVSDAAGRPVAVHCMDGAYIGSFDVALNKTYTSIAFQMSTAELGRLSGPGGSLYGIQFTNEGKIVIFGGGEVLERDGVIIGALGVSGGSAEQDTALAAYGSSVFEDLCAVYM